MTMQQQNDKIDTMKHDIVIGCFETVDFPDLGVFDMLAKIDTGAFSGALHCTRIRVVKRGADKQRVLKFYPLGVKSEEREVLDFEETYVRSSTGHRVRRYLINTTIVIKEQLYQLKIGLSDRSDMKRDVLIGRRFLRENGIIVDVRQQSELDDEGENTR